MRRKPIRNTPFEDPLPAGLLIAAAHTAIHLPILILFMLILPLAEYEHFFTSVPTGLSLLGIWRLIAALLIVRLAFEALVRRDRRGKILLSIAVAAMIGHLWMYGAVAEASRRWSAGYRVPASIQELSSMDLEVRGNAVSCLSWYGPRSAPGVPGLLRILEEKNWSLRSSAAHALGAIGPKARSALPMLESLMRDDPDWRVRDSARAAVQRISR